MAELGVSKTRFKYPEEDEYSSIDFLAVFSLVVGAGCSLAVVFSPVFLASGVLGIIFGLSSLVRINRSDGILSGTWVAMAGIGLSLLFFSFYVSHSVTRNNKMGSTSREFAEQWFVMIQEGKLNEAHQLTKVFFNRQLPGTNLVNYYAPKSEGMPETHPGQKEISHDLSGTPYQQREDFYQQPSIKIIRDHGQESDVQFVRQVTSWREGLNLDYVIHEFEISYQDNGKDAKRLFTITMKRENWPGNYGAQWAVDMIDDQYVKIDRYAAEEARVK